MKLAISIGTPGRGPGNIDDDVRYVQAAESMGVDFAWSAEAWGRDGVTPLAYLAALTSRITLGSGILQVPARTPALTAMTALTMASLSNNRFILGLGVSGPQVVEGLHGVKFQPALTRLKETVAIVRQAFRGEKLRYDGKVYELPRSGGDGKALRVDHPPNADIPIYLATLAPKSLEFTGAEADGWLGTSFSPDYPQAHLEHLRNGAQSTGRLLSTLDMQAATTVAIGDNVDELVTELKSGVAFQLGAMGSENTNFYNAAFRRAGFDDDAQAVQRLWIDGKRQQAIDRVPDELVLKFGLVGTAQMARDRVRVYRDAGITCLNLRIPAGQDTVDQRIEKLERAVEAVRG